MFPIVDEGVAACDGVEVEEAEVVAEAVEEVVAEAVAEGFFTRPYHSIDALYPLHSLESQRAAHSSTVEADSLEPQKVLKKLVETKRKKQLESKAQESKEAEKRV